MKENNQMPYEIYEDLKETIVKAIKSEFAPLISAAQPTDAGLPQQLEQFVQSEQTRHHDLITQLTGRLEAIERRNTEIRQNISTLATFIEVIVISNELPPRIHRHRLLISIESQGIFWSMIGMMATIVGLCVLLCQTAKPNRNRIDNDLKYRYIKMKGEASPNRIAELEEIYELNRDNGKIRQLKKNVEEYEQTIR